MAKQIWRNEDPLGRRLRIFSEKEPREIVGIAKTTKVNSLGENDTAYLYLPLEQSHGTQVVVQVKAARDAAALLSTARRELQQLEPGMPLLFVNTYDAVLQQSLWAPRMGAWLLGIFGSLALLLASIGLYGVMSYTVSQSTRELGIRLALGTRREDVRNMVVRQGVLIATGGIVLGFAVAFGLARLIANLLFGVPPTDPMTFSLIPLVLLVVAVVAAYLPAWRASRVDPVEALRV
jgi:ABC-type lipoprotein release transport system permease subunit